MEFYGTRYIDVLRLIQNNPALKEPLCACSPAIKAQVVYAIETEMAVKDEDIIKRRLSRLPPLPQRGVRERNPTVDHAIAMSTKSPNPGIIVLGRIIKAAIIAFLLVISTTYGWRPSFPFGSNTAIDQDLSERLENTVRY